MLQYLKNESNVAFTENGAKAFRTTESDCLDFFATVGAMRYLSETEIEQRFVRAYSENKDIATKLIFYARDIRGGLGERRVFRVIFRWLANNEPETVRKNVEYVAEYGRYDDLLVLIGTPCEGDAFRVIAEQLKKDMAALRIGGEVSLLAKWMPSVNTSNITARINAKKIARYLGMKDQEYRKTLVALRERIKIIENSLRVSDYTFDYAKQPSCAMFRYRKAFIRNDGERYGEFLDSVKNGGAKLHASNVYPYEIIRPLIGYSVRLGEAEEASINATWQSLPDYCGIDNALTVIDLSGSMYINYNSDAPTPASVALSLGIYAAERNKGCYKDHFIAFSRTARLIEVKGDDFVSKVRYVRQFDEVANTNLEAVFDLILDAAIKNNVSSDELPSKLIIISDMEFDRCVENGGSTIFNSAKRKYARYGYELPDIVFWNVASRNTQQPITVNDRGVTLVSGCTPRIFSMVASGKVDPYVLMLDTIESERYAQISA